MVELVNSHLQAAEETPDWDVQQLRGHVMILHGVELFMSQEERARYVLLIGRLRGRMREIMPSRG